MASIRKRTAKDGKTFFTAVIRLKGYKQVIESFERLTDAKQWAAKTEAAMREGRHFPERQTQRLTVKDMLQRYRADVLTIRRYPKREEYILDWWESEIGHLALSALTPDVISQSRDKLLRKKSRLKKPLSASSVQKFLIYFGHVRRYAADEWGWLSKNPITSIRKPSTVDNGRDRVLTEKEIKTLLDKCQASTNPYLYPWVLIALYCGCRWGEIRQLKWQHVDFKQKRLTLRKTKNKDVRSVLMTQPILVALQSLYQERKLGYPYVFAGKHPDQTVDLRDDWNDAVLKAELEEFRFHDLRHTCATLLAENGASLLEIATILGHRTMQMVKRYSHLTEKTTHTALERMNADLANRIALVNEGPR